MVSPTKGGEIQPLGCFCTPKVGFSHLKISIMQKEISMQVTAELAVNVIPNENYEFVMSTEQVAHGYGVSSQNIREHKRVNSEFVEGKHFVSGVRFSDSDPKNKVYWTKRGIIRLGFVIKSEQAKLFRDWAEDLIINVLESGENFLQPVPVLQAPKKRNHNRLTQDRMISILADVAKIEDSALRLSLISKLGV